MGIFLGRKGVWISLNLGQIYQTCYFIRLNFHQTDFYLDNFILKKSTPKSSYVPFTATVMKSVSKEKCLYWFHHLGDYNPWVRLLLRNILIESCFGGGFWGGGGRFGWGKLDGECNSLKVWVRVKHKTKSKWYHWTSVNIKRNWCRWSFISCTLETYMVLVTVATPIHSIKKLKEIESELPKKKWI